jgi:Flp pilus assembly protein TadB
VIELTVLAAMAAAGSAVPPRGGAHRRLTAALPAASVVPGSAAAPATGRQGRSVLRLSSAAVVLLAGIVVGGAVGIGLGAAGAAVVALVRPRPPAGQVKPDDVPFVVDLVAGCLASGAGFAEALEAAAVATDDGLREECRTVAAALRSGVPPDEAWRAWLSDPWLAPVARTAVRTTQSGAAAAEDLRRTSARLRARRRAAAQHNVRRASVWLVVPLGMCFLPAFVMVAVVPLVVGLVPSLR